MLIVQNAISHVCSLFYLSISLIYFVMIVLISINRLEEKFSDIESENQILRHQSLNTPVKNTSGHPPTHPPTPVIL